MRVGYVPFLGMAEGPDLIALDPRRWQVDQRSHLVFGAGPTELDQELGDRVDGMTGDPGRRPKAVALDQRPDDGGAFLAAQSVHN